VACVIGGLALFRGGGGLGTGARQPSYPSAPDYQAPTRTPRPPTTRQPEQAYPTQSPTDSPSWTEPTVTQRPWPTATPRPWPTATSETIHGFAGLPPEGYIPGGTLEDCWYSEVICVAVIDSGVDEIGNLVGRLLPGKDYNEQNDTSDRYPGGHGTWVAQRIIGQAPQAWIIPIALSNISDVDDAILWSLSWVDIINVSRWGWLSSCDNPSDNLYQALEVAYARNVPVFASARNLGASGQYALTECPHVIGVGAINDGVISYNTDQQVSFISHDQGGTSYATGYATGYAASMFLDYPMIWDYIGGSTPDDLLDAMLCRAAAGLAPGIEPVPSRGMLEHCRLACDLVWCPGFGDAMGGD